MTRTDLLVVLGVYGIAHGLLLACTGVYWDDWYILYGTLDSIGNLYREYGLPLFGYYHFALNAVGVPAYRVLVFLSYLVSALCLLAILRRVPEIDRRSALVLVLLFALFPSNSARISIMASRITVCYALFFTGFWLVSVYLDTRAPAVRIAALVCLFASFLTHSYLVFYAVVLIYIAYHERPDLKTLPSAMRTVLRHLDFLLLPVAFWALKLNYFVPYGEFRGYNRVTPESALRAFSFIDNAFAGGFFVPLVDAFRIVPLFLIPATIGALLAARLLAGIDSPPTPATTRRTRWFLLAGIVFFVLGVFPYLAVGKVPSPEDWDSRHQLLTPLGAAFMLVYLPRLVAGKRTQDLIYAVLIGVFLAGNMQQWMVFQRDWDKQVSLIENFRISPEVLQGARFVVDDRTGDLDANGRQYRPYEYAGLFQAAFGDQKRVGRLRRGQDLAADETAIAIDHGDLTLTPLEVLRLRVLETWREQEFRDRVRRATRLTASPPR